MRTPKPTLKVLKQPIHGQTRETVAEFSNSKGVGGLMSLRETESGGLFLDLYRLDADVRVRGAVPAVRFIVHTVTSKPDSSGNRYHWARITSTITGRTMMIRDVGGENNTRIDVQRALQSIGAHCTYPSVIDYSAEIPIRQWEGALRNAETVFGPDLTSDMILDLERPE